MFVVKVCVDLDKSQGVLMWLDPIWARIWGEDSGVMRLVRFNFFVDFLKGFVAQGFEIKVGLSLFNLLKENFHS